MRIHPQSVAFTSLLGLLAALPSFGIDMILPSFSATGAALGVPPADIGLAISAYLLGLGLSLVVYGPLSDRIGRKPIVIFGCVVVILASIGCIFSHSLPELLLFRVLQGAGASAPTMGAITMIRDLFEGRQASVRMAFVVFCQNIVPMMAPTAGAALLLVGGWQTIYLVPIAGAAVLLLAMPFVSETVKADPSAHLSPASAIRGYLRVLAHPICLGNILCNAGSFGAQFAHLTGSSLFLINVLQLSPTEYAVIFAVTQVAVMSGTVVSMAFSGRSASPGQLIALGLVISTVVSVSLLAMALSGGKSVAMVVLGMTGVAFSSGLIGPNAMTNALQPMPEMAGATGAVAALMQTVAAACSSALVAKLFDGHSAISMGAVMLCFCVLAAVGYLGIARPAERSVVAA